MTRRISIHRDTGDEAMSTTHTIRHAMLVRCACGALALLLAAGAYAAPAQLSFATPQAAADALADAWRGNSKPDLKKIFGPAGEKLVSSGDEVADRNVKARLAAAYDAQHRIVILSDDSALLVIGKDDFPFPIPLAKEGKGWVFDTGGGAEEILDRRIGGNELNAIGVCRAYVEAQRDYAARTHTAAGLPEYAMRIASSAGKRDGLYWDTPAGEEQSPLGPLIAAASDEGYGSARQAQALEPYHGYRYRILTRQGPQAPGKARDYVVDGHMTGGYALVAYPAQYGNSGIMTFIVNQNGIVFEKDLGQDTEKIAREMTAYDPDRSWRVALPPDE
jgi:hypothetical protein